MNKENLNNQNLSKLKQEKRRYGLTTKKLNTIFDLLLAYLETGNNISLE